MCGTELGYGATRCGSYSAGPCGSKPRSNSTPYSLLTTHYSLLTTPYSLLTTHYSLLPTPYSLLTTHYSLLTTHYSLLTTPYSLLPTPYTLHPRGCRVQYTAESRLEAGHYALVMPHKHQ
eukprot:1002204-Rhodomonas_salina.1